MVITKHLELQGAEYKRCEGKEERGQKKEGIGKLLPLFIEHGEFPSGKFPATSGFLNAHHSHLHKVCQLVVETS